MKLWGGRFGAGASPNAEAFGASIGFDVRLWPYDIMGSVAHCHMLARQGIIGGDDAEKILQGLATIVGELESGALDLDAVWEDIHTRIEARLHELIGEPAGRLHTARSRNDQVALDLRMFAREALLHHVEGIGRIQGALLALAESHLDTLMPGYTHLQRAQPVLLAHHLLAYVEMFQRDADRLLDCYRRTDVMPLGSGALAGVPYAIDRAEVARLLGFSATSRNSIDAVGDRDFAVEHVAALALVAAHLSRLAEEIVLWATAEFGFLEIDEAFATGSSIMPQKRNPDVAELIRGKTGRVYGHLVALLTVLKGLPLAYNKDLQEDKEAFFDAVDTAATCLAITADMLGAVHPRTDRLALAAGADHSTATDYADYLAKKGLPFREAHAAVGRLVRLCEARGCDLADLTLEELRAIAPLFDADAVGISARAAVEARDVPGGTAPSRVAAAHAEAGARLAALEQEVSRRRASLPTLGRLLGVPSPKSQVPSQDPQLGTWDLGPGTSRIVCRIVRFESEDFGRCADIRTEVFVQEQHVPPELEMDELDADAVHVLALLDNAPVGTGRLIVAMDGTAKIGRMAVLLPQRRRGVGRAILLRLMDEAQVHGVRKVSLAGQLHAIPFYERFGFTAHGDVFLDAGIEHRLMDRGLS